MERKTVLVMFAVILGLCPLFSQIDLNYQVPPPEILALADVELPPQVLLAQDHDWALLLYREQYRSLEELSQPELQLAGLRLNPNNFAPTRMRTVSRLAVLNLADGRESPVAGLPDYPRLANFSWSPDQKRIAFTHSGKKGLELWVLDPGEGQARRLTDDCLNGALGKPFVWFQNGTALLAKIHPADRKALIDGERVVPQGPTVSVNEGQKAQNATYQDLLKNRTDEFNFEQVVRCELIRLDLDGGRSPWLEAAAYRDLEFSPDGRYALLTVIERPYSYLVPYHRFPFRTTIHDQNGTRVRTMLEAPLVEVLPQGNMAVRTGMRELGWRTDRGASLYWVEALDQGDPAVETAFRDELFTLDAPFTGRKRSLLKLHGRLAGCSWGRADLAVVQDFWWNTRNTKTYLIRPDKSSGKPKMVFDRSYQDRYADPGRFVTRLNRSGRRVLETDGDALFLMGDGHSAQGVRPFLDRFDSRRGKTRRLWQADGRETLEEVVALRDLRKGLLLTRIQAKDRYPNYYFRHIAGGEPRPVTRFENPFAPLAGVRKEIIRYKRDDGVDLSGTLYYPLGHQSGQRHPMIIWAYPMEYKDKGTAGQVSASPHEFVYPSYGSPVFWVTRGYAVLDDAAFPIVGEGKTEPNDSFVRQLVANAKAAIDAVDSMGLIDRRKVAVGGHSYGAFMTANLLTHSDLFAAGIARSGAYNRSLTPFGFQSEERNFWEASEVYLQMSPFMHAHKMKSPLLLIHGAADNNSGTFTMQSQRYFNALKGLGATVRLVLLPFESHGYAARESVLHVLWEQDQWLERYVRNRAPEK